MEIPFLNFIMGFCSIALLKKTFLWFIYQRIRILWPLNRDLPWDWCMTTHTHNEYTFFFNNFNVNTLQCRILKWFLFTYTRVVNKHSTKCDKHAILNRFSLIFHQCFQINSFYDCSLFISILHSCKELVTTQNIHELSNLSSPANLSLKVNFIWELLAFNL